MPNCESTESKKCIFRFICVTFKFIYITNLFLFYRTNFSVSFHVNLLNFVHILGKRGFPDTLHYIFLTDQRFLHIFSYKFTLIEQQKFIAFHPASKPVMLDDKPSEKPV